MSHVYECMHFVSISSLCVQTESELYILSNGLNQRQRDPNMSEG